jgi:hypothetical protein
MVFWAWTEMWEISVCSSVSSGCVLPWRDTGGSEPFGYLWTPTSGRCDLASRPSGKSDGMEMVSARSRPLRIDHQLTFLQWRGCGVRLIVDSTLPIGGSVWSWWETTFLLRRLHPSEAGEGFHSFEGPLAGSMRGCARLGDAGGTYLDSSRMVGFRAVRYCPSSIRAGIVVQPPQSV